MLFAFVACSPDSSDSPDDNLLPGEVVPPSESEMVSASDEDMKKFAYVDASAVVIDCSRKIELEITDNNGDTITINTEVECKDSSETTKYTANGKVTITKYTTTKGTYTVDNLVVTKSSSGEYKIEGGSALKGESKMEAKDAYEAINGVISECRHGETDFKSYKFDEKEDVSNTKLLDHENKEVGSGKSARRCTITQDGSTTLDVYDWTVNGTRFQWKVTYNKSFVSDETSTKVYYAALNGKFFDEASCAKLAEYL